MSLAGGGVALLLAVWRIAVPNPQSPLFMEHSNGVPSIQLSLSSNLVRQV
jgi:hypothetical protein